MPVKATHDGPEILFTILGFSKGGKQVLVKEEFEDGAGDCLYTRLRLYNTRTGHLARSVVTFCENCDPIPGTDQQDIAKPVSKAEGSKRKRKLLKRFGLEIGTELIPSKSRTLAGKEFILIFEEKVLSQTPEPKTEDGEEDPFSDEVEKMKRVVLRTLWLERKGEKKIPVWWKKEAESAFPASLDCPGYPWLDKSLRLGSFSPDGATLALVLNSDEPQEKCNQITEPLIVSLRTAAKQQNTVGFRLYKKKQYKKAGHFFELSHCIFPQYATPIYNRACVAGLQKDAKTAAIWLNKLNVLGTPKAKKSLLKALKDTDLDLVRNDSAVDAVLDLVRSRGK